MDWCVEEADFTNPGTWLVTGRVHQDHYDFPVAYGFPVGHTDDNYPMIEGAQVTLTVGPGGSELLFLGN